MTRNSIPLERVRPRPIAALATAALAAMIGLSVLLGGTGTMHTHDAGMTVVAQPGGGIRQVACAIPDQARQTLSLIDAGKWPPNDGSGTKGGTTWTDREGTLPRTGANGSPVHYTEWDVNRKQPGRNRDAERIVTGDDGSAWYTGDHYATFCQIR